LGETLLQKGFPQKKTLSAGLTVGPERKKRSGPLFIGVKKRKGKRKD
jgi:hypothetical protein